MSAACTRCHSPVESEDLRCTVCGLPTPAHATAGATAQAQVAHVLRCHGCGAAVSYSAQAQAPRCDFCDSVMEVEVPEDPVDAPERFLRFRVDEGHAREALRGWLGRQGFFRPNDLQKRARVDALKPLWWVAWVFDADVKMTWAADSNAGAGRSAWAPHSGGGDLRLDNVVVSGSRGLSNDEVGQLIRGYNLADAAAQPEGHPSATVESFAVQRSGARRAIASALERVAAAQAHEMVPGHKVRKLQVAVLPSRLSSQRFAFPAYVLAYRYKDEVYRAVVHGQDASVVLGSAPFSWAKVALLAGGLVLVAAIVVGLMTVFG